MANPQVYGPDGVLRTVVNFSTSIESRFVTGTIPEDAVDVQVSINGSGFSSDADLVDWGDGTWTVPNPVSDPNGLVLLSGENTVRVRAILPSGSTSPETEAVITLVSSASIGVVALVPTNISVVQENAAVVVKAQSSSSEGFQGMNFYASVNAGGGVSGFTRINVNQVSDGTTFEEVSEFASVDVDADVVVDGDDNPVADPLYWRVTAQQQDVNSALIQEDFNERYEVPESARRLRMSATLSSVQEVTLYEFSHNRFATPASNPATVQVGEFSSLPADYPLYYVVTAVYYDSARNLEYESSFSEEVVGRPLQVTTALGSFPPASRQEIVKTFISAIFRSNPQLKVEAGSILRDTVIDPFASESERLRFILDFYHRARTPALLLQIDDPNGSGTSIPVSRSPYKQGLQQALYLESAQDVQDLIDAAFEAYASNFGVYRESGKPARGEATFYTTRRPTGTLPIPLGTVSTGGGVQFSTTRASSIPFERLASYYDPVSGRYQTTVSVRATSSGSAGNIGAGQLRALLSSLPGSLQVINSAAMTGGADRESNLDLTVRVHNALASVDSGTARGYLQTAADVAGIVRANVVAAGDDLMLRDLDSNGVHKGGKVDIWVQGDNIAQVTDTFAFRFSLAQDIQFEVIGAPANYEFRALDANLSEDNPIVQMIDDPVLGYELRNASTGDVYDLTNVEITSYNTIRLSTAAAQPPLDLTDVVLGSYYLRTGNAFVLPRQPVREIVSVVGTVSGELPPTAYELVHPNDPLYIGRSELSGDYIRIDGYVDAEGDQVPSGASLPAQEEHVLVGLYAEYLDSLGANFLSVEVWNAARTVQYVEGIDFSLTLGTETTPISITRITSGAILSGQTVSVNYTYAENFTVTYTTNLIVSLTQEAVDAKKHATADVLVKDAVPVPLDISATVVLIRGRDRSTVDSALRTNLTNFFSNLRLGDAVRQSDIIDVIERTNGVSYVVVPLTLLVRGEGSTVVREVISTDTALESTLLTSLSSNSALVYILENGLESATVDGGGSDGQFRAVFEDNFTLDLLGATTNLSSLGVLPGRAFIIGNSGRSISGYSDDATLISQGYVTSSAIAQRRLDLTANHVLVSVEIGDSPTNHGYAVTYIVGADSGAKNVDPGAAEYCTNGTYTFTYDEDR